MIRSPEYIFFGPIADFPLIREELISGRKNKMLCELGQCSLYLHFKITSINARYVSNAFRKTFCSCYKSIRVSEPCID